VALQSEKRQELWVKAHAPLLSQLLENLLDNASKYGLAATPIVVETRSYCEYAVLAVQDNGPGITEADLPHIFEPFYRSSQVRGKTIPGVGLGLAVVDRIASGLGGSINALSDLGQGTRFELRLPLVKSVTPTQKPLDGVAISANQCKLPVPFQALQTAAPAPEG
jgi:signal transduction histidine kinase